jgi:hypothetical protein
MTTRHDHLLQRRASPAGNHAGLSLHTGGRERDPDLAVLWVTDGQNPGFSQCFIYCWRHFRCAGRGNLAGASVFNGVVDIK